MKQKSVKVEGMTCQHCVQTITEALKKIPGLDSVAVDLDKKEVDVKFDENETSLQEITGKIVEVGFELPKN
ncbi:MAG: heavy-metal-associated domain-containing protein [Nitrospinae bacterium]|nr:heavy-metal-associated domain-containing protein [Nitrospinota bacterium]